MNTSVQSSSENDRERSNCQNNLHLGQRMLIFVLKWLWKRGDGIRQLVA